VRLRRRKRKPSSSCSSHNIYISRFFIRQAPYCCQALGAHKRKYKLCSLASSLYPRGSFLPLLLLFCLLYTASSSSSSSISSNMHLDRWKNRFLIQKLPTPHQTTCLLACQDKKVPFLLCTHLSKAAALIINAVIEMLICESSIKILQR
jgi:hypothetical protein